MYCMIRRRCCFWRHCLVLSCLSLCTWIYRCHLATNTLNISPFDARQLPRKNNLRRTDRNNAQISEKAVRVWEEKHKRRRPFKTRMYVSCTTIPAISTRHGRQLSSVPPPSPKIYIKKSSTLVEPQLISHVVGVENSLDARHPLL